MQALLQIRRVVPWFAITGRGHIMPVVVPHRRRILVAHRIIRTL